MSTTSADTKRKENTEAFLIIDTVLITLFREQKVSRETYNELIDRVKKLKANQINMVDLVEELFGKGKTIPTAVMGYMRDTTTLEIERGGKSYIVLAFERPVQGKVFGAGQDGY